MWIEITRGKYAQAQRYASGLTDAEWALIEPHMSEVQRQDRPRETELRACSIRSRIWADRLPVADAAEGLSAVCDGARLFLRLSRRRLVYRNRRLAKDFEASIASAKAWSTPPPCSCSLGD
jgi:hypothetical protein